VAVAVAVASFAGLLLDGIMKPEPAAYHLAPDALGLPADRVPFVDDQPKNVAGAGTWW